MLALAPDDASARAATGLARPAPWSETGAAGDLVWGLCAGSGKNPYQAIVDLSGPAYRCSCPSRKFPCKHALGLLLLWAGGTVPDAPAPADYALAWLESRREKASRSSSGTMRGGPSASADSGGEGDGAGSSSASAGSGSGSDGASGASGAAGEVATDGAGKAGAGKAGAATGDGAWAADGAATGDGAWAGDGAAAGAGDGASDGAGRDGAGSARRAEERARRVAAGLAELVEWLRDQVRVGLASVSGPGHADAIAARMVDAQAPGVAGVLRGLSAVPASGDGWPARLLADYARLHLLARAYERLDALPPGLAAVVRSRVGFTTGRQEVLGLPAVTDHWLVIGVRDLLDGNVPGRRIWLRGRDGGRDAMLLTFAGNGYWQDPDTARLRAGTELHADLHYYPGQPALRATVGERHAAPGRGKRPEPDGGIDALLARWAAGLADDPWLTTWPVLLDGTPVPPALAARGAAEPEAVTGTGPWYLVDRTGAALPLAEQDSLWTLLAVSGGHPVTIAGEWNGERLLPLTVWHHDMAVPL